MELDVDSIFGEPEQYTCRVCLSTETKLFHLIGCELQNDFHNITGIQISRDDKLPQFICFICREFLKKAAAFRKKSIDTQNMLSLQVPVDHGQMTASTPLISLTQMDTLLISILPDVPTAKADTTNIINHSLLKEEKERQIEHNVDMKCEDKLSDTEAIVKEEINEHSNDNDIDFDMDVGVLSKEINESHDHAVIKEVDITEIIKRKAKPKRKANRGDKIKLSSPKKGDVEVDTQTVKNYLLCTNTDNIFAVKLNEYIINKYIDETKKCNIVIDKKKGDYELIDSEDESTPCNKLIMRDDSAEIDNLLTLQTDMEPSKKILYEFIKEKYVEKKIPAKESKESHYVKINSQIDKRLLQMRMTMEELRNKCNMEIKVLSFEEQIAELKKRSEIHKNSLFQCEECFRRFQSEKTYNYHMKCHDPAESGNIKCEVCKKRFFKRYKLLRHQLMHKYRFICKECGCVTRNQSVAKEHAKSHSGQNSYECEYCLKVFSKSASRVNHIRIKHGSVECEICYDLMAPSGLKIHNVLRHTETFKCQYCDKVFNDADAVETHKSYSVDGVCNSNEKPCTLCGESFTSESKWTSHIQEHRRIRKRKVKPASNKDSKPGKRGKRRSPGEKYSASDPMRSVMCEMCGDTFHNQANMRYHQRIHTGEKPYACTYCPKRFRMKNLLTLHIYTHTGERPYQCHECPKSFKSQTALYRHNLVHTKERRYRCTYCEKNFMTSTCVKMHIKTVHLKVPMPPRVRNKKKRAE